VWFVGWWGWVHLKYPYYRPKKSHIPSKLGTQIIGMSRISQEGKCMMTRGGKVGSTLV